MGFEYLGCKYALLLQVVPNEILYTPNRYATTISHEVCWSHGGDLSLYESHDEVLELCILAPTLCVSERYVRNCTHMGC